MPHIQGGLKSKTLQFVTCVTFHILQGKVGGNILKVCGKLLHVSCSKFSQLSNSEKKRKSLNN